MKKLFIEPVMEINVFDVENIVTGSTGTQVNPDEIDSTKYVTATTDWAADTLNFTF